MANPSYGEAGADGSPGGARLAETGAARPSPLVRYTALRAAVTLRLQAGKGQVRGELEALLLENPSHPVDGLADDLSDGKRYEPTSAEQDHVLPSLPAMLDRLLPLRVCFGRRAASDARQA